MNRMWYVVLWVLEVLAIAGLVLAFALPIQNNALREYIQWQQHPSAETYKAFLEKHTLYVSYSPSHVVSRQYY